MIGSADARVIHQLTGGVPWSVRQEIEDWPEVAASYARSRLAVELAAIDGLAFAPDAEKLGRTYGMLDGFEYVNVIGGLYLRAGMLDGLEYVNVIGGVIFTCWHA